MKYLWYNKSIEFIEIMLKKLKKDKKLLSLYILAGIFFFVYSFLSFGTFGEPMRFNSPDETANYFFTKKFAQTGEIFYFEDQNLRADDVIHPRSTKSISGKVVPTSFLGLIIFYGFVAKILGIFIIPFLTPLLAVVGVLFFYLFVKNIFDESIAYLSSILLFFFPAYWYYSSKVMYHNVAFLVFLIIAFYFLSLQFKEGGRGKKSSLFFSGLFFGLALSFRLSEIIWIFFILLVVYFYYFKKISYKKIVILALGLLLPLSLMLFYNNILYSSPFSSGYSGSVNNEGSGTSFLVDIYNTILPFGFNFKAIVKNFINYFLSFFWFFSIPAIIGFFIILKDNINKRKKVYLISYFILAIWLLVYYGSWQIRDNISLSSVTIGNSYIRYWLPMYIFALPFVAIVFFKVASINFLKNKIVYFLTAFFIVISFNIVVVKGEESILRVRNNVLDYKKDALNIYNITEDNSIILSRYEDKVFFPERRVVFFNPNNYGAFEGLVKIMDENRIYFYDKFIPQKDIDYINNKKIKHLNIEVIKLDGYLYEIVRR
jgi:hypothetical protein